MIQDILKSESRIRQETRPPRVSSNGDPLQLVEMLSQHLLRPSGGVASHAKICQAPVLHQRRHDLVAMEPNIVDAGVGDLQALAPEARHAGARHLETATTSAAMASMRLIGRDRERAVIRSR